MDITTLGIDLAKNIFQVHGADSKGKAVLRKKLSRKRLCEFVFNLPKCTIVMEACGGSNQMRVDYPSLINFYFEHFVLNPDTIDLATFYWTD